MKIASVSLNVCPCTCACLIWNLGGSSFSWPVPDWSWFKKHHLNNPLYPPLSRKDLLKKLYSLGKGKFIKKTTFYMDILNIMNAICFRLFCLQSLRIQNTVKMPGIWQAGWGFIWSIHPFRWKIVCFSVGNISFM